MPSLIRPSIRSVLNMTTTSTTIRPLTTTTRLLATKPPPPNYPPGAQQHQRTKPIAEDAQSSASTKGGSAKSGDDHPAKQPDPQAPSDRSTGFQEVDSVKGGKEGLGARSDKQG